MANQRPTILTVDDDPIMRRVLDVYLRDAQFEVVQAGSGAECRALLRQHPVDLILLDVNLPDIDGFALAQEVRRLTTAGIIFVTNLQSEVDRVVGLELAGDDYVTKPVELRELLARIRAVLRRLDKRQPEGREPVLSFGRWTIDLTRRELSDDAGEPLRLTRGEFDLRPPGRAGRGPRPAARARLSRRGRRQPRCRGQRAYDRHAGRPAAPQARRRGRHRDGARHRLQAGPEGGAPALIPVNRG